MLSKARGPSRRWRHDLPFSLAAFERTPAQVVQPALADDVVCVHRGGAKRVYRHRDARHSVHDVPDGAITILPRHRAASWRTEGPIAYHHLTLDGVALDRLLADDLGTCWRDVELRDDVGFLHPLLGALAGELVRLASADGEGEARLYVDSILACFALALTRRQPEQEAPLPGGHASGGMAPWRLRRVTDFIRANSDREIGLDELIAIAGVSRAHLFRAFRHSTGTTPGRYLQQVRVEHAQRAIDGGADPGSAAAMAGFGTPAAMARAFRRVLNVTPDGYRRWRGPARETLPS